MAWKNLLVNGKNKITARANGMANIQNNLQNMNTASNMQTVTTPNLPTPTRTSALNLNLQKAQQPVQTRLNNVNQTLPTNTTPIIQTNTGVWTVAQNPTQSRFIWFQKPQWQTLPQWRSPAFVQTDVERAELENKETSMQNKESEDMIRQLHRAIKNANGNLTKEDISKQFKQWKGKENQVLELQKELRPLIQQGQYGNMRDIEKYYPELLQTKGLKNIEDVKAKSELANTNFQQLSKRVDTALKSNWYTFTADWMRYLQDFNTLSNAVEQVKKQRRIVWWANDFEIMKELVNNNPELQKVFKDWISLDLSEWDKAKLGRNDANILLRMNAEAQNTVRNQFWWLSDEQATNEDLQAWIKAREKLENEFGKQTRMKLATEIGVPLDSLEKFTYRTYKDWQNEILKKGSDFTKDYAIKTLKSLFKDELGVDLTDEQAESVEKLYNTAVQPSINQEVQKNQQYVMDYAESVNKDYENRKARNLDPDIEQFYNNRSMTNMLLNGDLKWFAYKAVWETAQNAEMPLIIAAWVVAPEVVLPLMAADSYSRESQESFEELMEAQEKMWIPQDQAYQNAQEWAAIVWLASSAVEVWLEKLLWWVETTASKAIHDIFMKDFTEKATKMVAEKWLVELLKQWAITQFRSSLEEWLEEIVQQWIHNAAIKKYDPDQKITEWMLEAFEWWFFNPMNLLAWGGEVYGGIQQNSENIKQTFNNNLDNIKNVTNKVTTNISNTAKEWYNKAKNLANRIELAPWKVWEVYENMRNKVTSQGKTNKSTNQQQAEWINTTSENQNNNINWEKNNKNEQEKQGIIDRITDWGAEKMTNTVSAQDKLYKAQEPRMNVLSNKKNLEKRRANSDRANELILENGYKPTNTAERLDAHQATLNKLWKQVKDQVNQWEWIKVDQTPIINALSKYIAEKKALNIAWIESELKALERELESMKKAQKQWKTDLPILENKKQVFNDIIDWKEQEASEVYKWWIKVITSEIWKIEDEMISNIPWEFSKLKRDVWALLDSYEDVFKADMKNQRSKWLWLAETYSRIEWVWDILEWLVGVFSGNWWKVIKWAWKVLLWKALAKAKDVDFLIKNWFEELSKIVKPKQDNTSNNVTPPSSPTPPATPKNKVTSKKSKATEKKNQTKKSSSSDDTTPPSWWTPTGTNPTNNWWTTTQTTTKKTEKNKVTKKEPKPKKAESKPKRITAPKKERQIIKNSKWENEVVYHWTDAEFDKFDKQYIGRGGGFWFTTSKSEAESYWKNVKAFNLEASNIMDFDSPEFDDLATDIIKQYTKEKFGKEFYISPEAFIQDEWLRNYAQELWYDALKFTKWGDVKYIVYNEDQIIPLQNQNQLAPKNNITSKKTKATNPAKTKETGLFNEKEVDKGKQSEWLNPDAMPLSDYKEMQRLNDAEYYSLSDALRDESLKKYMARKITTKLVWNYDEIIAEKFHRDLEDEWVEKYNDVIDMYEAYEEWDLEAANKYANDLVKWKTAKELIDQYKPEYESDLKVYNRLIKKYPWVFSNWKIDLTGLEGRSLREFANQENETAQDIDYQALAEMENETSQTPSLFEEDIIESHLKALEENETPQADEEEFNTRPAKPKNILTKEKWDFKWLSQDNRKNVLKSWTVLTVNFWGNTAPQIYQIEKVDGDEIIIRQLDKRTIKARVKTDMELMNPNFDRAESVTYDNSMSKKLADSDLPIIDLLQQKEWRKQTNAAIEEFKKLWLKEWDYLKWKSWDVYKITGFDGDKIKYENAKTWEQGSDFIDNFANRYKEWIITVWDKSDFDAIRKAEDEKIKEEQERKEKEAKREEEKLAPIKDYLGTITNKSQHTKAKDHLLSMHAWTDINWWEKFGTRAKMLNSLMEEWYKLDTEENWVYPNGTPRIKYKFVSPDGRTYFDMNKTDYDYVDYELTKKDDAEIKNNDYSQNLIPDEKHYTFNDVKNASIDSMLITDWFKKYTFEEDWEKREWYAWYLNWKAVDIIPDKKNDIIRINVWDELMRSYDDNSINVQLKDSDNIISVSSPYDDAGFKLVLARALWEKAPDLWKPNEIIYKKWEWVFEVYDDIWTLRMNARPWDKLLDKNWNVYDLWKEFDNTEYRDWKLYYANTRNPNSKIESRDYFKGKDIIWISKWWKVNTDVEAQKAVISEMDSLTELNNILENKKTYFEWELGWTPVKVEALNSIYDRLDVDYLDNWAWSDRVSMYELTTNNDPYSAKIYTSFDNLKSDLKALVNWEDIKTAKTTTEVTWEKNAVTAKPAETNKPKNLVTSKSKVDEIIEDANWKELKVEDDGVVKTVSYEKDWVTYAYNVNNSELKELFDRWAIKNADEKAEKQAKIDEEMNQNIKAFDNTKPKDLVTNPRKTETTTKNSEIQEIDEDTFFNDIAKNLKAHPREMFIYKKWDYFYPKYILSSWKIIVPENTYWGEVRSEEAAREWLKREAEEYSEENEAKKTAKLQEMIGKTAEKYEQTLKRIESDNPMQEIWTSWDYFKYGLKESQMNKARKEAEANADVWTFKKEIINRKEWYRVFVAWTKNQAIRAFYEPETWKIYKIYRWNVLDDSRPYTTSQVERIEKFLWNVDKQLDRETKKEKVEEKTYITQEWLDSLKPDKDGVVELDTKWNESYALRKWKEALIKEWKADWKYIENYWWPNHPQYLAFYIKNWVVYEWRKWLQNQYMTTKQEAVDWVNEKEKDVAHEETPRFEQTDYETLPKTIDVETESEVAWPKRIAPDRVKRQQETYDKWLETIKEIVKAPRLNIDSLGFKSDRSKAVQDILAERRRIRELPESEADKQWTELARGIYEWLVIKDISRWYRYPEDVTSRFPKAQMKKAIDARARYEKGLFTSFSSKDTRANNQYRDEIWAWIKSQDWKPVTQEQMQEIVDGIRSFGRVFWLDMKKFAEDNSIIYVHLHGGNPFLMWGGGKSRWWWMNIAWLYRRWADWNISISLWGVELVMEKWEDWEMKKNNVNATPEHELAHAVDYMLENKLFSSADIEILKNTMNEPTRLINYYNRSQEIVARAVEQYAAYKEWKSRYWKPYVESQAYWNQEKFDKYVKPIVEKNMNEKMKDYKLENTRKNVLSNWKNNVTSWKTQAAKSYSPTIVMRLDENGNPIKKRLKFSLKWEE